MRVEAIVEFVDIFPTLVAMAGLPALPPCPSTDEASAATKCCTQGRSLVIAEDGPAQDMEQERAAFSLWVGGKAAGYTIRSGMYRYTEWVALESRSAKQPVKWEVLATELYNHTIDSLEGINIASAPGSASVAAVLSQRLRAGWRNQSSPAGGEF
jgi:iduronate 2-sulfatase